MPIIAATGHRPDKLGGYFPATEHKLYELAKCWLLDHDVAVAVSGMALGWDTAFALAALDAQIALTCAIPFPQQPSRWPPSAVVQWAQIKRRASRVVMLATEYSPRAMQQRNEWMVDNCDQILALWNGSPGGTANCLRYAQIKHRPVINLWPQFKDQL